ncbi:MAG: CBS domain-containing protein [Ilumatobacter sp.]|nr:CBS domain-containing protein [Ilumatobacter sp.]
MNIRDLMTRNPIICTADTKLTDVAKLMRDEDIGDVLVGDEQTLCGIVTDRDIVVRGLAERDDVTTAVAGDVCSDDVCTVDVDDDIGDVVQTMEQRALRRVPVTDDGSVVGIVSLGDLATALDEESALGKISAAAPSPNQ